MPDRRRVATRVRLDLRVRLCCREWPERLQDVSFPCGRRDDALRGLDRLANEEDVEGRVQEARVNDRKRERIRGRERDGAAWTMEFT